MAHAAAMIASHPIKMEVAREELTRCIEACLDCAQTCTACADACLGEDHVGALIACIRANLDCADICETTARFLSRQTALDWQLAISIIDTCAHACEICAEECEVHANMHEHCRVCAEACNQCLDACRALMAAIPEPTDIF
jgi:hypothetical protein